MRALARGDGRAKSPVQDTPQSIKSPAMGNAGPHEFGAYRSGSKTLSLVAAPLKVSGPLFRKRPAQLL